MSIFDTVFVSILVEPYAPCIIQGCEVNAAEKRIGSGMVALWEVDENNQKTVSFPT